MLPLNLAGIVPFSTVDWPGRHAAVLFCRGCPWRCDYCHNRHLQEEAGAHPGAEAGAWLLRRMELLDGVVLSGGEPLAQEDLPEAVRTIVRLGFPVGLHTGGACPERLEAVLPDIAWVGFDLKAPWDRYAAVTGCGSSGRAAWRSLELLAGSGVPFEVRTTVHAALTSPEDLERMADIVQASGATGWVIQHFRATGCPDPALLERPSWGPEHEAALVRIRRRQPFPPVSERGSVPIALSA